MSINDKPIWVVACDKDSEGICISNENVPALSIDSGTPQRFTYNQIQKVKDLVSQFLFEILKNGRMGMIGRQLEISFS